MAKGSRISVLDLVIMVAATAPGLVVMRALPQYIALTHETQLLQSLEVTPGSRSTTGFHWKMTESNSLDSTEFGFEHRVSYWLVHVPCWASPCLLSWSLAALALSFKKPRPRPQHLASRPGVAAGFAVILAIGIESAQSLRVAATCGTMRGSLSTGWPYGIVALTSLTRLTGCLVATGWIILALSGRWSPERNSGGTIGRALGWAWIAMALSSEVGLWCFALNH